MNQRKSQKREIKQNKKPVS